MSPEWWENAPENCVPSEIDPEVIVKAVERMELGALGDPLSPRAAGGLGFAAHMRRVFAPAFESVYAKRRTRPDSEHEDPE